jgi:hypothetical protein
MVMYVLNIYPTECGIEAYLRESTNNIRKNVFGSVKETKYVGNA